MNLLIDTDPGMGTLGSDPEDSLAITLAAASPEARLRAVTVTQGNVPLSHGYANARHLLGLLDLPDVPLAAGARLPLQHSRRPGPLRWLAEKERWDRIIPAEEPKPADRRAVELIAESAAAAPLTIVAIGPLTNLAAAITAAPELADAVERVVVMGGAFQIPGNITPSAEFNFWMDPDAAQVVLSAGLRPTLVGLDVCHQTVLTRAQVAAAPAVSPLGSFVRQACAPWFAGLERAGEHGLPLFDSLAVGVALFPDLVETRPAWVEIETAESMTAGASLAWFEGSPSTWTRPDPGTNADVAVAVDVERFTELFAERVLSLL